VVPAGRDAGECSTPELICHRLRLIEYCGSPHTPVVRHENRGTAVGELDNGGDRLVLHLGLRIRTLLEPDSAAER
jgi:hypothetical protein